MKIGRCSINCYKVFVHLRSPANEVVAQADRAWCDTTLNEADWRPGDILVDEYELTIPAETPPGDYPVVIGLYQDASGARLPVVAAEVEHDGDSVTIGTLRDPLNPIERGNKTTRLN